jgi:hypothetical protein
MAAWCNEAPRGSYLGGTDQSPPWHSKGVSITLLNLDSFSNLVKLTPLADDHNPATANQALQVHILLHTGHMPLHAIFFS